MTAPTYQRLAREASTRRHAKVNHQKLARITWRHGLPVYSPRQAARRRSKANAQVLQDVVFVIAIVIIIMAAGLAGRVTGR